ncbi:hypothetical protein T439DRAFT_323910 [Meredithblackwellia eburnea MCA 4105]
MSRKLIVHHYQSNSNFDLEQDSANAIKLVNAAFPDKSDTTVIPERWDWINQWDNYLSSNIVNKSPNWLKPSEDTPISPESLLNWLQINREHCLSASDEQPFDSLEPFQHWVPPPPVPQPSPLTSRKRQLRPYSALSSASSSSRLDPPFKDPPPPPVPTSSVTAYRVLRPRPSIPTPSATANLQQQQQPPSSRHVLPSSVTKSPTDVAQGAIQRCIPPPYRHQIEHRRMFYMGNIDPPSKPQIESSIRRSFVDPTAPTSKSSSRSNSARGDQGKVAKGTPLLQVQSSSTSSIPVGRSLSPPPPQQSKSTFPIAYSHLQPGRRGKFLIPISAPLPIPSTSKPAWGASAPTTTTSPKKRGSGSSSSSREKEDVIYWTDDRLKSLWKFLDRIHDSDSLGSVEAECFLVQDYNQVTNEGGDREEGGGAVWPDHVRVNCPAEFALALRAVLRTVKADDGVRFLERSKLVWVDESGMSIFLA